MSDPSRVSTASGSVQSAAATDASYDSMPSWGQDSTTAIVIKEADFPRLGAAVVKKTDSKPRPQKSGHVARKRRGRTKMSFEGPSAKPSTRLPTSDDHESIDLIDFSDEDPPLDEPTVKTLEEYRGEPDRLLPKRAKQWADLDLEAIQKKVNDVEDFQKQVTEPSLLDDEHTPSVEQAERLAGASVPVELQRKRKGKKGKTYYSLSPFVNY